MPLTGGTAATADAEESKGGGGKEPDACDGSSRVTIAVGPGAAGELTEAESEVVRVLCTLAVACAKNGGVVQVLVTGVILGGVFCVGFKPRCGPLKSGQFSCTVPPSECCNSQKTDGQL